MYMRISSKIEHLKEKTDTCVWDFCKFNDSCSQLFNG